jgi:hypothetical protein
MVVREGEMMALQLDSSHRHRFSLPDEPARAAKWSLLMVVASAGMLVVAGLLGTFLQLVVLGLEEQETLPEAGAPGYVAMGFLLALMLLPALAGMALGVRARRLGERRLGTTGMIANAAIAAYLVLSTAATVVLG